MQRYGPERKLSIFYPAHQGVNKALHSEANSLSAFIATF